MVKRKGGSTEQGHEVTSSGDEQPSTSRNEPEGQNWRRVVEMEEERKEVIFNFHSANGGRKYFHRSLPSI